MSVEEIGTKYFPKLEDVNSANIRLSKVMAPTPLVKSATLSEKYCANIYLKREDLQQVRSYKIRGAYNKISCLSEQELKKGVVCSSAGNHAQGVAISAFMIKTHATIFMPVTTPKQKIQQVRMFGKDAINIQLIGDSYDQAYEAAIELANSEGKVFIHPFDDPKIIEGQATVGSEIVQQAHCFFDYLFMPIGGGGLASGVGAYMKTLSPETKLIGVEPKGAPAMHESIRQGKRIKLKTIDTFVDGASVQKVGKYTFDICKELLNEIILVPEGLVCSTILQCYNQDAIVVEPAGALSISALELYKDKIKGKNICCIVSGSNNDITRTEEIKERALMHEGLKHYFIVRFPQRAGALKDFVNHILNEGDDITLFEYSKKHNRDKGPALIGVVLAKASNLSLLTDNLKYHGFDYEYINGNKNLFEYLI